MDVSLRQLRAFLAVALTRSYTGAAAELGVSQPAVTRLVASLEGELGVRLVERSTRRVELTMVGRDFLDRVRPAVLGIDRAVAVVVRFQRELALGCSFLWPDPFTGTLVDRAEAELGVRVTLHRTDDPTAALQEGRVDAIVARRPSSDPGIGSVRIGTEQRLAAVSTASALSQRSALTWRDVFTHRVVVNTAGGSFIPADWPSEEVGSADIVTCTNFDEWLELVALDRGIGVIPELIERRVAHSRVVFLPLEGAPPVPLELQYPLARASTEAITPVGPTGAGDALPGLIALARQLVAESRP
jgi:DNA-binding transcriptional LysR family regulator